MSCQLFLCLRIFFFFFFSLLQSLVWFTFPSMNHIQSVLMLCGPYIWFSTNVFFLSTITIHCSFTCQETKNNAGSHYVKSDQIAHLEQINKTPTTSAGICSMLPTVCLNINTFSLSENCCIHIKHISCSVTFL